jgi:hypothetical protein
MPWQNTQGIEPHQFTCGHCGNLVGSNLGYSSATDANARIHICPFCDQPTYVNVGRQAPGSPFGNDVMNLPDDVDQLYREAREAVTASAYTAAVLVCRKLLMNMAVERKAKEGLTFVQYVEYLAEEGYVPPEGKGWVDHIRRKGNEANHEIAPMARADAEELISFVEMLLKFVYEFPSRIPPAPPSES